jgi:carboxypeptidase family protein/TonB-dependent receptor-like protein
MNRLKQISLGFWIGMCLVPMAYAQLTTATLRGTVEDSSGGAIPGAEVKLENLSQGVSRTAVTGEDGRFSFDFVVVGTYRLEISHAGFATAARTGLDLSTGQVLDLPIQMELQTQAQSVEVSSQASLIDTTTATQVADISTAQVQDLPVAHLNWSNLLVVSAGTTVPAVVTSLNSTSPAGSGVNVNGLPSAGYSFTVDGTNNSSNMVFTAYNYYQGTNLINSVNNDAIQELSTAKGVAPATVGGAMSSNINIVTKAGTNEYHGSLHELNEVSVFDARNQFLSARPRTTFNDYGVSVGGPIMKNKLFFFTSYEGAELTTSKAITGGVPSPYLISVAPKVFDPLFALFPQAPQPSNNPTATVSQYFGVGSNVQKDDNGVYRLDYYLTQNSSLALRYVRGRPNADSPALLPSNPRHYIESGDAVNLTYTHSSANWSENSRVAYNKVGLLREDAMLADPTFFNVTFPGLSSAGSKLTHWYGNYRTFQQSVVYVHGIQTIQFGGIIERNRAYLEQISPSTMAFSNLTQLENDTPQTVTLQLNSFPSNEQPFTMTGYQYGMYFQDDVKVTKDFTLNLGLRYDYFTVPTEIQDRIFNRYIDPNNPQLGPGFGPVINKYYNPDHGGYQPRIGVAYNLFGAGKTVFRAGFGKMEMGHTLYEALTQSYQFGPLQPFSYALNASQTAASGINYPYNATTYLQQIARLQTAGIISTNIPVQQTINLHDPNPYSLQWTAGVTQVVPWGMTLEVNYNGNRGLHEALGNMTMNQPNRLTGIAPVPTWGTFGYETNDDRSKYAAVQITLRKRFDHGLQFASSFTKARVSSFSDADNLEAPATDTPQNPYNFHAEWGPAPFDIEHRSVTQAIWDIPIAKWTGVQGHITKMLVDGWQISGVFTAQSGLPANVTTGNSANSSDRPDACACGVSNYENGFQSGVHQYLNPGAFTKIPIVSASGEQSRVGDLERNAFRSPGLVNLDATLAKNIAITERYRLTFRADTFNTLNHTNLSGLITTLSSSTFGQLTLATARTMQLGLRLNF